MAPTCSHIFPAKTFGKFFQALKVIFNHRFILSKIYNNTYQGTYQGTYQLFWFKIINELTIVSMNDNKCLYNRVLISSNLFILI